ncbi:MAG: CsgG/HfaB family protein [Bryobacteraceae bacterium]|jgi:curli biogenesis system outer membrane secretion channel CsgG
MKRSVVVSVLTGCLLLAPGALLAQGTPAPKPKPAAAKPKPATPVDKVVRMLKAGLSEDLVVKQIVKENLQADLSSDDMIRLKEAGASDRVVSAVMDPLSAGSAPAPAPAPAPPAPQPEAPPAAEAPGPAAPPQASGSGPLPNVAPDARSQLRRAAIDEFDFSTVKTAVQSVFQTNVDIGKGIRALLTTRLQQAGKIRIVERAKVNTVMKEQDFGASNRVKKGTNARIGQIIGADVYLMGDIVAFGRDDRNTRVNAGAFGVPGPFGHIRVGKSSSKAVVVIDYRLVDAETSEIIDSGEARGESKRESKGFGGMFGVSGEGAGGGGVDMTSSNFGQTIIGEATIAACDQLAAIMNSKVPGLPKKQMDIEARVADVSGNVVTLAAGSNDGIQVGDRFEVFHILSEIKDPVSGEILDSKVEKAGDLVITSVRERIAFGQYSGGPVSVKNFTARKVQQQQ